MKNILQVRREKNWKLFRYLIFGSNFWRISTVEFSYSTILTPYNYHEWKLMIFLHLRSKVLYQIVMGIETEPMSEDEKLDWINRSNMAYGILCLSVSHDILYEIRNI